MKIVFEKRSTPEQRKSLLRRPGNLRADAAALVETLCLDVKKRGDAALREYSKKFDQKEINDFHVSIDEMNRAERFISAEVKRAFMTAAENIRTFHQSQQINSQKVETTKGVTCWRESRPLERVGLYIPAGTAPLPSTVFMLGIPAVLAGCKEIILCSPPRTGDSVDPYVLAASSLAGIHRVFKIGGAQAIAGMAYGTGTIPRVDKIFGPGNAYVTAAKQYVSKDPDGAAIDLLAGPSEVLLIADDIADPDVVAFDLLSQAEHGIDAQAILVTPSQPLAEAVLRALPRCASKCSRDQYISAALEQSYIFVADSLESALQFSNEYAPEHLVVNVHKPEQYISRITNAGSVFIGPYAPVTAGDYASGTNHTLPTNGSARWASGVSLDSFRKNITFQSLTKTGLEGLSSTLTTMAETEGLQAHARAVTSRLSSS